MLIVVDGVSLEVDYSFYPGCKGSTENGLKMEPDTEDEVEVLGVSLADKGQEFYELLSEKVKKKIEDAILSQ
jgi:hypothetical protein